VNQRQREEAKARYAAQRQARSAAQARLLAERAQREAEIGRAFGKPAPRPGEWAPPMVRDVMVAKAPRLLASRHRDAVTRLVALPALRSIHDWSPRGKGADTLFRSLAAHLLARFQVPAIVWNAFHDDNAAQLVGLAAHVAAGGSLYDYVKEKFPIPLTRKMCHELLATPAEYRLLDAIRRVQARAAGADVRFFSAWRTTRYAQQVGSATDEAFWSTVVVWFAKIPMLDPAEIGPLFDYIDHRHREDPLFSMKGRSALVLLRGMREWHGNQTKELAITGRVFPTSGFTYAEYTDVRREPKGVIRELWQIKEVLTAKALADEGRRMGHCVYSYAWRIEKGDTSIWSVQMEDGQGETGRWHMVTLEVRNDLRRVVQARGRFNRAMTPQEVRIVRRWVGANNLSVTVATW
jgi:PcfJ-like protein